MLDRARRRRRDRRARAPRAARRDAEGGLDARPRRDRRRGASSSPPAPASSRSSRTARSRSSTTRSTRARSTTPRAEQLEEAQAELEKVEPASRTPTAGSSSSASGTPRTSSRQARLASRLAPTARQPARDSSAMPDRPWPVQPAPRMGLTPSSLRSRLSADRAVCAEAPIRANPPPAARRARPARPCSRRRGCRLSTRRALKAAWRPGYQTPKEPASTGSRAFRQEPTVCRTHATDSKHSSRSGSSSSTAPGAC